MAVKPIIKTSGDSEDFSPEKLIASIIQAGADTDLANEVEADVEKSLSDIYTTDQIHKKVFNYLKHENSPIAARYNLRRAIIDLGPTGFPFEQFTSEILKAEGYDIILNQVIQGECVSHEVDILARDKSGHSFVIENKFHMRPGIKSGVQVALYMKSRYDDIVAGKDIARDHKKNLSKEEMQNYVDEAPANEQPPDWKKVKFDGDFSNDGNPLPEGYTNLKQAWLITNTKFSADAAHYAKCKNMRVTAWSYPKNEGLGNLIDRHGIHPVTALTKLTRDQEKELVMDGIVLCRQLLDKPHLLHKFKLNDRQIQEVLDEAKAVCGVK